MNSRLLIAASLLLWLLTGAFVRARPVQAGGPIVWRETIDDLFATGYCGFPMEIHTTGVGVFHLFLDDNGEFERLIITEPEMRITFTNLLTGESVWSPSVNMVEQQMVSPDSGIKSLRGLLWHLVVPGEGLVTADVGRIDWLFTFDALGNIISEELVFSAGIQEGVLPLEVCGVLG